MNKPLDISQQYILTTNNDDIIAIIHGDSPHNEIKQAIKKYGNFNSVEIVLFKPVEIKDFNILVNITKDDYIFPDNYYLLNLPK